MAKQANKSEPKKIFVKAKPSAKEEKIQKISENHYLVSVKEPPIAGKANRAIIKILAEYFKITPSRLVIISGNISKQKVIQIL